MKKILLPFVIIGYTIIVLVIATILTIEAYITGECFETLSDYY